jgi:hypothetical protein
VSGYQYYEFQAIDRPLTKNELEGVRALSSRARISATHFVNEYHYGNFRGDERKLVEQVYDAHLYFANWGSRRLLLRLPTTLLPARSAEPYCAEGALTCWTRKGCLLLDFFHVAGLVDHQHRLVIVEVLHHVAAHVVADGVGVPLGPPQQVLHAVRGRLPGPLGDRPAVLARQVRQQPEYQLADAAAGFDPGEPSRDQAHQAHQALERLLPAGRVYAVTCGHRMIVCLHTPMISGGRICLRTGPLQQDHDLRLEY